MAEDQAYGEQGHAVEGYNNSGKSTRLVGDYLESRAQTSMAV